MPLHAVLFDYVDAMTSSRDDPSSCALDDPSFGLIMDALRLSSTVLDKFPDMVAAELTGRLLPYYSTNDNIRELCKLTYN